MNKEKKWRAGILGATGSVGQKLVRLLDGHPWFELTAVAASARSAGQPYGEAVHWLEPVPLPPAAAGLQVQPVEPGLDCDFVFSALDAAVAQEAEPAFARAGIPVISNASSYRMHPAVPLIIPEINPRHLDLVHGQEFAPAFIVTNPNCSVTGLALALKPLSDAFGLEQVLVTTMQAVSGAGYPGVPSLDILGNVLPHIPGEDAKIESEPQKILGQLREGRIQQASMTISAQANRVAVLDGHTLSVAVKTSRPCTLVSLRQAFDEYQSPVAELNLPTAPARPLAFFDSPFHPQPRLHASLGQGMTVSVGNLRPCPVLTARFTVLVHNTWRGAAGAALLNAELLASRGLI